DLAKPLAASLGDGLRPGFVLFGHRLSGTANAVVGPLFGLYLLVYAAGIWRMRRWALPMGTVYAAYVIANLTLFMLRDPEPMREGALFGAVYALVAIGVSWGAGGRLAGVGARSPRPTSAGYSFLGVGPSPHGGGGFPRAYPAG